MLRKGLAGEVESGQFSPFEETIKLPAEQVARRFEHYELVKGEDGKPVELGRGAMGVTYKAVDVDLHRPVTLKVIKARYLGDESAQLRFLREARAAASVRHANVASVFHLGRTGQNYFYAMEFVEGETLEHLIKRSGRLEVKLALEIATQVAAGLAAVPISRTVVSPGDDPKHELVVLMIRRDTTTSSDPDWNESEQIVYEQADEVAGTGTHRGYFRRLHKNGDTDYGTYEGMHKTSVKEDGSWETTWEGDLEVEWRNRQV
jgi:hypothetical protein